MDDAKAAPGEAGWVPEWAACTVGTACAEFGVKMSASLSNARLPYIYSRSQPGFVVRPSEAVLLCAWERDGKTSHRVCGATSAPGCVPGCVQTSGPAWARGAATTWCTLPDTCPDAAACAPYSWCPFRPQNLRQMLERHSRTQGAYGEYRPWCAGECRYNEVVLDAAAWEASLPALVEAIFVPAGAPPGDVQRARQLWAQFRRTYGQRVGDVPLLRFDPSRRRAQFTPL